MAMAIAVIVCGTVWLGLGVRVAVEMFVPMRVN